MDLPLSPTPRADHGIMTVWGKSLQAASGSKVRAEAALSASRRRSRSSGLMEAVYPRGQHGLAIIGLCIGGERKDVGPRVAYILRVKRRAPV